MHWHQSFQNCLCFAKCSLFARCTCVCVCLCVCVCVSLSSIYIYFSYLVAPVFTSLSVHDCIRNRSESVQGNFQQDCRTSPFVSALTQMLQLQMQMLVVTQATQVTQAASAPAQRVELGSPYLTLHCKDTLQELKHCDSTHSMFKPPRDPQGAPKQWPWHECR